MKDLRPSICGICAKPATGLAFKNVGACSHTCLDKLASGEAKIIRERALIVNDESLLKAHGKAGQFLRNKSEKDLSKLSKHEQLMFCKAIIVGYLNGEIKW